MDVCLTDRFHFLIMPHYLLQGLFFFLLELASYLLNLSFNAMQSGFLLLF